MVELAEPSTVDGRWSFAKIPRETSGPIQMATD